MIKSYQKHVRNWSCDAAVSIKADYVAVFEMQNIRFVSNIEQINPHIEANSKVFLCACQSQRGC